MLELVDAHSARAAAAWRDLASATSSYFLSWGWIENWLACVPHVRTPALALLHGGGSACFLGRQWVLRRGVVPTRELHVNATGDARFDSACSHPPTIA